MGRCSSCSPSPIRPHSGLCLRPYSTCRSKPCSCVRCRGWFAPLVYPLAAFALLVHFHALPPPASVHACCCGAPSLSAGHCLEPPFALIVLLQLQRRPSSSIRKMFPSLAHPVSSDLCCTEWLDSLVDNITHARTTGELRRPILLAAINTYVLRGKQKSKVQCLCLV